MIISGVYKIQSIIKPTKIYIGSSVDINKRWNVHLSYLRKNKHHSPKLQYHFNKYGESDFVFSILEPCLPEFLIYIEQRYIDELKPFFNIMKDAIDIRGKNNPFYGRKHTPETIQKLRDINIGKESPTKGKSGKPHTEEWKKQRSKQMLGEKNPLFGRGHSDETKAKMKNREKTAEHRLHLSEAKKGKGMGKDNPFWGRHHSLEKRSYWSKIRKGRTSWNKGTRGVMVSQTKKVVSQFDLNGNFLRDWDSGTDAAKELNLNRNSLRMCAQGKYHTAGGFIWKFKVA